MILSTRSHRRLRTPLLPCPVADHALPAQPTLPRDRARPLRDPDWAIREIVDAVAVGAAR